MKIRKKVSFDFDGTLDNKHVQEYAKELIKQNMEVHIVTSRYEDITNYEFKVPINSQQHADLYLIADKLNIPNSNIHFTNMSDKYLFFIKNEDFLFHLDDDYIESKLINQNTNVKAVSFIHSNWKKECNNKIK